MMKFLALSILALTACGGPVADLPDSQAFAREDGGELVLDGGQADAGTPLDAGAWPILHCVETPDCATGDICVLGRCEPDPRILSCADAGCEPDCERGQECASGYECVGLESGDKCFEDANCPGEECVEIVDGAGFCSVSGRDCSQDADCAPIPCIDGACIIGAVCREQQ